MLAGALQILQAVAKAPQRPGWEKLMIGCLLAGAGSLFFAAVSLIGHPRRSMPMRKGTREWLSARQGPPALALAILLFLTAAVVAIVR